MNIFKYRFPYNPDGTHEECLIENERHTLVSINEDQYQFIMPEYAPFFEESLSLVHSSTGRALESGKDFILTHKYRAATRELEKGIYSSITFLNKKITGKLLVSYSTIGGKYTARDTPLLHRLVTDLTLHRSIHWDDITGKPDHFKPRYHTHRNSDIHDMDDVIDAIEGVTAVLSGKDKPNHRHDIDSVEGLQIALDSKIDNNRYVHFAPVPPYKLLTGSNIYKLVFPIIYKDMYVTVPIYLYNDDLSILISIRGKLSIEANVGTPWVSIFGFTDNLSIVNKISGSYEGNNIPSVYLQFSEAVTGHAMAVIPMVIYSEPVAETLKGNYQWELANSLKGNIVVPSTYASAVDIQDVEKRLNRIRLNTILSEDLYLVI